ncbi:uncharacterized protein RMCC_5017 [Mycolicibacterium canariasense]|uniref:DUF2231 domain-containing protein n=1 Tax=Mycolicibacterium canariasense TaxID=228230 RepID=A0A100WGX3_MYCCR|nr:DUF2231 domain-containing protein [Mycolicibacterium canariasense]MCV7212374.1 hypothetical protein [Mycolicibacterium canariasense]ORV15551.1 hypothetical protein AWB94_04090 [Mycolicibacterium canariasense]GAS98052.1 uncharacterized protein RMCC_5017 [Mycolicibacterium canariasense]
MDTIAGLPAHPLLVHAIVVLVPLVALLEILCALWPAARDRLVWLVLVLAAVTAALAPLTVEAGEAMYADFPQPPAVLQEHAERGSWMPYVCVALLVVAVLLALLHWRSGHGRAAAAVVALLTVVVGLAAIFVVVRVGDSGGRAVWGGS